MRSAQTVKSGSDPSGTAGRGALISGLALASLGAALGVSQIIGGAYDEATWAPIALGALALVLALALGVPRRPPLAAVIPLLALIGLWLWSLVSTSWSESSDAAHIAADRWLLYGAVLAVLWWMVGEDRRRAIVLLAGASAGVLGVAGWMLVRMLGDHGASLFLGVRLTDPLGYVNGQAGYLLAGAWPCLALAQWRRSGAGAISAVTAGAGLSGLIVLVALGLLTQSRSWGIGLLGAALLVLIVIPGRRRRACAVLLAGVTVALIYPALANVWRHPSHLTGVVTNRSTHQAAVAILVAALAAGVVWTVLVLALERLAPTGSRARTHVGRLTGAALASLVLAVIVGIGFNAGAITRRVHGQYEAFVHLAPSPVSTRLFSGGGNRYDYWRVALIEFGSAPVRGVGAGNYQPSWYLHRRTAEEIQQPHSLELQTLAELGLVGALLLAGFLTAVAFGLHATARAGARDPAARWVAVAAGGTFTAWLIQTSLDWLHLFPGLSAIALAAAVALLVRPAARRTAAHAGRARIAGIAGIAVAAVLAGAGALTIAPRVLSLHAQASAQRALAERVPRAAIADASRALDYDPSSVGALLLRAAGFARLHAFGPTLADLRRAIAVEPHNWVTWALLGDLLTRRGDSAGARSAYERALKLNPLEAELGSALKAIALAPKR
ncbi:MAG: tetratricopeptide repeat protein [Solirubrobacteraceae bacterium]